MTEGKGIGPVSQLLAIAEELTIRGLECAFVANRRHSQLLGALGYRCFVAPVPDKPDPSAPDYRAADALRALGATDPDYFARAVAFEERAVDRYQPDALVSAVKFTSAVTARTRGLPLVSIAASTDSPSFTSPLYPRFDGDVLPAGIARFLASKGLDDVRDFAELSYERSDFRVAPYSPEFDPFLPTERLRYVGPLLSRGLDLYRSVDQVPTFERDLIVVYLNRGSQPVAHYLETLARLAALLPEHQIVAIEPDAPATAGGPSNLTVLPAGPILRLLTRAELFITGGGYNAIVGALLTGTPIVGLPGLVAERDFNLRQVVALGAGALVSGHPADPDQVVTAVRAVLSDPEFRADALAAGDRLRRLPGPAGVVAVLESLTAARPAACAA